MLQKFANADILEARVHQRGRPRIGHRHSFEYDPRPGYLYVRSRAISSRTNDNYDNFPAGEIRKGYRTFIGKPVFVNHHNDDHRRARGVIIDAALHEDRNPDGSADTWVEVLMEISASRFPKLTEAILAGEIERTSMGVDVEYSLCSVCSHKATTPLEYCKHIPKMKGMKVRRATASGGHEEVLVYEKCYGLSFFENSLLVEEPADPTAYFLGVDDRGLAMAASLKTAAEKVGLHVEVLGDYRPIGWEYPDCKCGKKSDFNVSDTSGLSKDVGTWACRDHIGEAVVSEARSRPMEGSKKHGLAAGTYTVRDSDDWSLHLYEPGTNMFVGNVDQEVVDAMIQAGDAYFGGGGFWGSNNLTLARDIVSTARTAAQSRGPRLDMVTAKQAAIIGPETGPRADNPFPGEHWCQVGRDGSKLLQDQPPPYPVACYDCGYLATFDDMQIAWTFAIGHQHGHGGTASRRHGFGEVTAPVEVDTLRDEFCPVCGEADSFDGDTCKVCNYIKPPDEFLDPDLDKAKQVDLHQETEAIDEEVAEQDEVDIEEMPGDGDEVDEDGEPVSENPLAPDQEALPDEEEAPPSDEEEPPDEDDDEDEGEDEEDEDDEDGKKPPWMKGKGKGKSKNSRLASREGTGGGPVMGPAIKMLLSQQRRIRALERQNHALTAGLQTLARLAGVERHITAVMRKVAQEDENPAQPEGWALPDTPAPEPAAFTTEETLGDVSPDTVGGGAVDEVTTPGDTSETDVAPDAQTSVTDTGTVLDEPLDLNEQDVEAPVAGTDTLGQGERGEEGTNRTETEIRIGDPNASEVAFAETGWTEAARSFAALRLARARINAGIVAGDDLALGTAIASSKMTNREIQTEIDTLDKVVASRGSVRERPRLRSRGQRAPRVAAEQRSTPSLAVPTPQLAYSPSDDEFLLEP